MASNPLRTYILTGSVASITALGAWYGAGLNIRQEQNQKLQELAAQNQSQIQQPQAQSQASKEEIQGPIFAPSSSPSPAQKIELLQLSRMQLVRQREELEAKIRKLEGREAQRRESDGSGGESRLGVGEKAEAGEFRR